MSIPQILCATSVNPAIFVDDCYSALPLLKDSSSSSSRAVSKDNTSISLIWIVTGVPNLTKVGMGYGVGCGVWGMGCGVCSILCVWSLVLIVEQVQ